MKKFTIQTSSNVWFVFSVYLSVYPSSICDSNITVHPLSLLSEDRVGSASMVLHDYYKLYVILHFNMSLHKTWTVYSYAYDTDMLGNTTNQKTVITNI